MLKGYIRKQDPNIAHLKMMLVGLKVGIRYIRNLWGFFQMMERKDESLFLKL